MTSAKKTSSNSKSSSPSKKSKVGSPMKKKASSSPNKKQSNSPKKAKKTSNKSSRPGYQHMVTEALTALKARGGSSRSKILNYLKTTYGVESGKSVNSHLRTALEGLLEDKTISVTKGTGYGSNYYKLEAKGKKSSNKRSSSPNKNQGKSSSQSQAGGSGRNSTGSKSRSRSSSTKKKTNTVGRKSSKSPQKKIQITK